MVLIRLSIETTIPKELRKQLETVQNYLFLPGRVDRGPAGGKTFRFEDVSGCRIKQYCDDGCSISLKNGDATSGGDGDIQERLG